MSVDSVSSAHARRPTQASQRTPEKVEVKKAGKSHDGDSNDGGAKAEKPAPAVNTNGQKTGKVINTAA